MWPIEQLYIELGYYLHRFVIQDPKDRNIFAIHTLICSNDLTSLLIPAITSWILNMFVIQDPKDRNISAVT